MYRSCSKCGGIHATTYKCQANPKDYSRWKTDIDKLRSTYKWKLKANEIKEASQYLCSVCRDNDRYTYDNLEVHHIVKLKDEPNRLLDNTNLICLCTTCHKLADKGELRQDYLFKLAKARDTGSKF